MNKNCIFCNKSVNHRELPLELIGGHILCRDCDDTILYDLKKIYKLMPQDEFNQIKENILDYAKNKFPNNIVEILAITIDNAHNGVSEDIETINYIGPFENQDLVYTIDGVRGRHIDVYRDKVVITTIVTLGSILTSNATDGEKTIYYSDCIGVQFKKSKFTIGYLQLETASTNGNNIGSNFFAENSFTFDETVISNEKMEEVSNYVKSRVEAAKKSDTTTKSTNNTVSIADELMKLKQLLDMGVLSQEEFDNQKNKLLNQ